METEELYHRLGLDDLPKVPKKSPQWARAKLTYIGAEGYVLGTTLADVQVHLNKTGYAMQLKNPVMIDANALIGPSSDRCVLYDILIKVENLPELSLASVSQRRYPYVLRTDELVTL